MPDGATPSHPLPNSFHHLINGIVRYSRNRNPKALDLIFDALPQNDEHLSPQILAHTVAQLRSDLDTLGWFCGYMASEINHHEDSERAYLPIVTASKLLIGAGMTPFVDFVPYPGQRLVILDAETFDALPASVHAALHAAFDLMEQSATQFQQVNDALRQEFTIQG